MEEILDHKPKPKMRESEPGSLHYYIIHECYMCDLPLQRRGFFLRWKHVK